MIWVAVVQLPTACFVVEVKNFYSKGRLHPGTHKSHDKLFDLLIEKFW